MALDHAALGWVESSVGGRVCAVTRLTGGVTARMYRVRFADSRAAVLRRWDAGSAADATAADAAGLDATGLEATGLVRREAHALETLVRTPIPSPRLIAADPLGTEAGVPSLLMSLVPGEVDLTPSDLEHWLHELAATLAAIHATDADAEPYESWSSSTLPRWAERDELWIRAFQTAWTLPDSAQRVFLHRDFQHFNVLWRDGRICGVVDWPNAGTGPLGIDVGHCRLNLAVLFSAEAAERFLQLYQSVAGRSVDPRADVAALCSFSPDWQRFIPRQVSGRTSVDRAGMRSRVEDVVRQALRRL